jgi:SAM-dependent methyltransferase
MKKINIGCGRETKEGFDGIDIIDYGQKHIVDVRKGLPFKNNTIDEVYSRHFLICLTNFNEKYDRVKFFNELFRVMKPGSIATLIIPSWNAAGGYANPTFQEAFYEGVLYFLNKDWRTANNPEVTLYTCDFDPTWGYSLHPALATRNQEYQQFAIANYCNASTDIMITLKKRGK